MRLLVLVGMLSGCGRLQFDAIELGAGDAASDAAVVAPCGLQATVPAMVTFRGTTFEYTSFMNASTPVAGVTATVRHRSTLASLGQMVSAANGAYAVDIATGGMPVPVAVDYVKTGFWSTREYPDLPLDRDTAGNGLPLWSIGDAPVWSPAAMQMVYTASGVTRVTTAGFLNVAVRDCGGNPIPGVKVTVSPSTGSKMIYQSSTGQPSQTLTVTELPFAHALAINVPAGLVRVTATLAGRTFLDQEVMVQGGDVNTLAVARAID